MSGTVRQIIGSFEDIGKDVIREVAKVPKDIGQAAIESLGTKSGNSQTGSQATNSIAQGDPGSAMEQISSGGTSQQAKQAIARAALQEISGVKPKPKEPGVWDKQQKEAQEKEQLKTLQAQKAAATTLVQPSAHRPKGDLYGIKANRHGSEVGKNVKSD